MNVHQQALNQTVSKEQFIFKDQLELLPILLLKELIKNQSNEILNCDEKNAKQINDIKKLIKDQSIEITSKIEKKDKEIDELKKILAYNNVINELIHINSVQANKISFCKQAITQLFEKQENDISKKDIEDLKELVKIQSEKIEKLENQHSKDIKNLKKEINENVSKCDNELKNQDIKIEKVNSTLKKLIESFNSLTNLKQKKSKSSSNSHSSNSQNNSKSELLNRSTNLMESSPEVNSSAHKSVPKVQIDNSPKFNSSDIYSPRSSASQYSNLKSSLNNDQINNNYRSNYTSKSPNYKPNVYSSKSQNNNFYGVPLGAIKDEDFLSQQYDNRMSFHSSGMKISDSDSDDNSTRSMYGRDDYSFNASFNKDRYQKANHENYGSSKKRITDESD